MGAEYVVILVRIKGPPIDSGWKTCGSPGTKKSTAIDVHHRRREQTGPRGGIVCLENVVDAPLRQRLVAGDQVIDMNRPQELPRPARGQRHNAILKQDDVRLHRMWGVHINKSARDARVLLLPCPRMLNTGRSANKIHGSSNQIHVSRTNINTCIVFFLNETPLLSGILGHVSLWSPPGPCIAAGVDQV